MVSEIDDVELGYLQQAADLVERLDVSLAEYCSETPDILTTVVIVGVTQFLAQVHAEALTPETILNREIWPAVIERVKDSVADELRDVLEVAYARFPTGKI